MQHKLERQREAQSIRRRGGRKVLLSLTALVLAAPPQSASARGPFGSKARVTSYYRSRVVQIKFVGELYNGDVDKDEGSGLLIGDSLVVTSSHVIPRIDNYRKATTTVKFLTDTGTDEIEATLTERDAETDLAVIRLATPRSIPQPACPIESFTKTASAPPGSDLVVLGYPVDTGYGVTAGVVSNQNKPGRWQTDAAINPGNSGGPIFDLDGYLLGFAVAGMTYFGDDKHGSYVSGVNFFVPIQAVIASQISKLLQFIPSCWTVADADPFPLPGANVGVAAVATSSPPPLGSQWTFASAEALTALANIADPASTLASADGLAPPSPQGMPQPHPVAAPGHGTAGDGGPADAIRVDGLLRVLSEQVPVSWIKDDHDGLLKTNRIYIKRVTAEPGYIIESCNARAQSANNSESTQCIVAADGKSADFRTTLQSGPFYDRWRGWWHGQLTLSQRLVESADTGTAPK